MTDADYSKLVTILTDLADGNLNVTSSMPADPFGANADSASASGSISAKLRFIAATGIPVTSLPALAAGTNLLGKIANSHETSTIYNGTTALTPKFALANVAASQTDANIVTAVSSKKIRVLAVVAVQGATASAGITFNSKGGGAGTAISALFAAGANNGFALGFNPVGWFETASGEALTVTTGAGATVGIQVVYVEV